MISQLGNWFRGLNLGDRSVVQSFITMFQGERVPTESHLSKIKVLVCGLMFGSSAILPSFYALRLKVLGFIDFALFLCSATAFGVLNRAELAQNAPWTLAGSLVVFTLLLVFHGFPPEAFGPYIPFSIALCLQVTTHAVPRIREYIHRRNRITLGEYIMATRGETFAGTYRAVADPYSEVPSFGASRGDLSGELSSHPLEFDHMDPFEEECQMRGESPDHTSSLDLESGRHGARSSTLSAGSRDRLI